MGKINHIKGRLAERGMTVSSFAKSLGISRNRAHAIVGGERAYNAIEIEKASALLDIPPEEIPHYFYGTLKPKEN
jgi:plasmid maintenance system antidote protein VapI